jgi:hypothetical protein
MLAFLRLLQFFLPLLRAEPRVFDALDFCPHLVGEFFRAVGGEQHVLGLFHHQPGQRNRMPHGAHRRDATAAELFAIHDRGIQLVLSRRVEHRAAAGVEQRVVF